MPQEVAWGRERMSICVLYLVGFLLLGREERDAPDHTPPLHVQLIASNYASWMWLLLGLCSVLWFFIGFEADN